MHVDAYHNTDSAATASQFTVGSVVGRTFSTLFKRPGLFFGLTFLAALITFFIVFLFALVSPRNIGNLSKIVAFVINSMIQGAIAYAVYRVLRKDTATIGSSLSHGFSRALSIIFASILMGLAWMLCFIVGGMMMYFLKGIGVIFFFICMLIAAILMCMWAVSIPACAVERLGPVESLQRSAELTLGHRWKIFGLMLLLIIVMAALGAAIMYMMRGYLMMLMMRGRMTFFAVFILLPLLVQLIPQTFSNVMSSIMYYDLRAVKEGVDLDNLTNVFD